MIVSTTKGVDDHREPVRRRILSNRILSGKRRRLRIIDLISAIGALGILAAQIPIHCSGNSDTASSIHVLDTSTTPISFEVTPLNLSGFTIGFGFGSTVTLSGGSVSAGQDLNATAELQAPTSTDLKVSYLGVPVSLPINPLGSLYEVPIPGLSYGYHGIAELGLYLNLSGTIVGNVSAIGPARIGVSGTSWNTSGSNSIPLHVWPNASDGSVVTWSLSGLEYGLSIGIDAVGLVLGFGVTVPLVSFGSVGLFPSSPSAMKASYALPPKQGGGLANSLGSNSGAVIGLLSVIAIALVIVIIVLLVRRKKGERMAPPSAQVQPPIGGDFPPHQ